MKLFNVLFLSMLSFNVFANDAKQEIQVREGELVFVTSEEFQTLLQPQTDNGWLHLSTSVTTDLNLSKKPMLVTKQVAACELCPALVEKTFLELTRKELSMTCGVVSNVVLQHLATAKNLIGTKIVHAKEIKHQYGLMICPAVMPWPILAVRSIDINEILGSPLKDAHAILVIDNKIYDLTRINGKNKLKLR